MKLIFIIIGALIIVSSAQAQSNCESIKGKWYYTLMSDSPQPVSLVFTGCDCKEEGNPMGNRKGTAKWVADKKQYEVEGLTSSPGILVIKADYSYIKYTSWVTDKTEYLVLSRTKRPGSWYAAKEKELKK
jgi:hypothetical protein